jgi:hypothetical protein
MRLLPDSVQDPVKLESMIAQLTGAAEPHGAAAQAAAFLHLLRRLTEWLSRTDPRRLDTMFAQMGRVAGRLSADAMLTLLDQRKRPESMIGTIDVAGAVVDRMEDTSIASFVATSVIKEHGASERLAHAFQALVPDVERQRQLLALAEREVAASEKGNEGFAELSARVEGMLTSYSDETFVSNQYARELSSARTRAIDVERTSDSVVSPLDPAAFNIDPLDFVPTQSG